MEVLVEKYPRVPVSGKYSEKYGNDVICSLEDFDSLSKHKWHWSKTGYARTAIDKKTVSMSRHLLNATKGQIVDHVNGDPKDNRRENLRIVSHRANSQNRKKRKNTSTPYIGVHYSKKSKKYVAVSNAKYLGRFDDMVSAAEHVDSYNTANGGFQKLNFPEKIEVYKTEGYTKIRRQNKQECTEFKGVYKINGKLFRAKFSRNHIGYFETAELAARARDNYIVANNILEQKLNFQNEHPGYAEQRRIRTHATLPTQESSFPNVNMCTDVEINIGDSKVMLEREDYEKFKFYKMCISRGYVLIYLNSQSRSLSRCIMNATEFDIVDHVQNNPLDNRKRKLRITDEIGNARNRKKMKNDGQSRFIGITKARNGDWMVYVKSKYVISHQEEEAAARLRDIYILTNFPTEVWQLNFVWNDTEKDEWKIRLEHMMSTKRSKTTRRKRKTNISGFIGVSERAGRNEWRVKVMNKYVGTVKIKEHAARLRDLYIMEKFPNQTWTWNFNWTEAEKIEWRERLDDKLKKHRN
jgi:hypothetical protein